MTQTSTLGIEWERKENDMASIFRCKNEIMEKIRNISMGYTEFVNAGGRICEYTDVCVDKVIELAMILKEDRDMIYGYCNMQPEVYYPQYIDQQYDNMVV